MLGHSLLLAVAPIVGFIDFLPRWNAPEWVAIIGLPLAALGIYLAYRQLRETKSAAVAAKEAVERTERHVADNHMLLFIPRMTQLAREVQYAVEQGERQSARTFLTEWREVANQVRTLETRRAGRTGLVERIETAVALINAAEDGLTDSRRSPVAATSHVRERMKDAGDLAMEIVTEKITYVSGNGAL